MLFQKMACSLKKSSGSCHIHTRILSMQMHLEKQAMLQAVHASGSDSLHYRQ